MAAGTFKRNKPVKNGGGINVIGEIERFKEDINWGGKGDAYEEFGKIG